MEGGWDYAGAQARGSRSRQEDFHALRPLADTSGETAALLAILADGMGGHVGGAEASRAAVAAFEAAFLAAPGPVAERLASALEGANERLARDIRARPSLAGMGCTLVAAHVTAAALHWISVGDSHLYLHRRGRLRKLNDDHSLTPSHGEERDGTRSGRHVLRSAITGRSIGLIDLPSHSTLLAPGDVLVMASDGLNTLARGELERIIEAHGRAAASGLARTLIATVEGKKVERQDNVTVLVLYPPTAG